MRTPFLIIIKNRGGFLKGARASFFSLFLIASPFSHAVRNQSQGGRERPVSEEYVDVQGLVDKAFSNLPEAPSSAPTRRSPSIGTGSKNFSTPTPARRNSSSNNFSIPPINGSGWGASHGGGASVQDSPPSGEATAPSAGSASSSGSSATSGFVGGARGGGAAHFGPGSASPKPTRQKSTDKNINFYVGSNRCKAGVIVFGDLKCYATNRGGYASMPPDTVASKTSSGAGCSYLPPATDGNQSVSHSSIGPLAGGRGRSMTLLDVSETGTGAGGNREKAKAHYANDNVISLNNSALFIHSRDYIDNTLEGLESGNSWGCTLVVPDCMTALADYLRANPGAQFFMHESQMQESMNFDAY